jgi:hypothetical protein
LKKYDYLLKYINKLRIINLIVLFICLLLCINYLIPVGKNNRYGHPNKEVLENLNKSKIYRTDIDGSIMFKIKNNKLRVENCSP